MDELTEEIQEPWEELTGQTMADMLKDKPHFKSFSARRINGKTAKPKRFKVPIPARKSIWSVLGPYTTGRYIQVTSTEVRKRSYFDGKGEFIQTDEIVENTPHTCEETAKMVKVGRSEFTSELQIEPDTIVEALPQGPFDWPPKNWTPSLPIPQQASTPVAKGRWIKAMFAGKCADCGTEIKANDRSFYYRECRAILCQDCGTKAARRQYEQAA